MKGRDFAKFIRNNKHRDLEAAEIKIEERLNTNNQNVSQILFYFWDSYGMGDYIILSSKKISIDHSINTSLMKYYNQILIDTKKSLNL